MRAASSPHDFKLMVAAQARIAPRSHPNKGAGEISGAPADARRSRRAHRCSAGGSRPGVPPPSGPGGPPAAPPAAPPGASAPPARRPPRAAAAPPAAARAVGRPADSVGAAPRHPVLIA